MSQRTVLLCSVVCSGLAAERSDESAEPEGVSRTFARPFSQVLAGGGKKARLRFHNVRKLNPHSLVLETNKSQTPCSRVPVPRVIYSRERVRAAREHADDILLAAQVLERHNAAAAHHHLERLAPRPRLDDHAGAGGVGGAGRRTVRLVVPVRYLDGRAGRVGGEEGEGVRPQLLRVRRVYMWVCSRLGRVGARAEAVCVEVEAELDGAQPQQPVE